jgi:hypothetical protein
VRPEFDASALKGLRRHPGGVLCGCPVWQLWLHCLTEEPSLRICNAASYACCQLHAGPMRSNKQHGQCRGSPRGWLLLKEAGGLPPLAIPRRVIHTASGSGSTLRRCSYASLRPTCIAEERRSTSHFVLQQQRHMCDAGHHTGYKHDGSRLCTAPEWRHAQTGARGILARMQRRYAGALYLANPVNDTQLQRANSFVQWRACRCSN